MPRKKHIHKYMRRVTGKIGEVWTCGFGCGHYLPKHLEWMIDGRQSICWECDKEFRIDDGAKQDCLENMEEGIGLLKCINCRAPWYNPLDKLKKSHELTNGDISRLFNKKPEIP
jgi:hypothetical protein